MPTQKRKRRASASKTPQYFKGLTKLYLDGKITKLSTTSEKISTLGITTELPLIEVLVNRKKYKVIAQNNSDGKFAAGKEIKCFVTEHVKKLGSRKQRKYLFESFV